MALDALELDIAAAVSGEASGNWVAPTGLGPIPAELKGRAELLAEAQTEAMGMVAEAQSQAAKHINALDRIPEPQERSRLAILDATG